MIPEAISHPAIYDLPNLNGSPKKDQAKNPHHERAKVVSDAVRKRLKVDEQTLERTMELMCSQQDALTPTKCQRSSANETFPYDYLITDKTFIVLKERRGEGTYSIVYEAMEFPTVRHENDGEVYSPSGTPKKRALKVSKHKLVAFSPEKRKLEPVIKSGPDGLDYFIKTWRDREGNSYALNHLFQTDLMEIKFHEMQKPVSRILEILISASHGLEKVHNTNMIHRDIKASNILVSYPNPDKRKETSPDQSQEDPSFEEAERKGVITDFNSLMMEQTSPHQPFSTFLYADPSAYGDVEAYLINQKAGSQSFRLKLMIFLGLEEQFIMM